MDNIPNCKWKKYHGIPFTQILGTPTTGPRWAAAQPVVGGERVLQVCPPLLFPCTVRDGAPQTLTKLFVFESESSYNILPTNFDFVCKNY